MGGFIALNAHKLLNGKLRIWKSSGDKVTCLEFGKCLRVERAFKLFQNIRKFCGRGESVIGEKCQFRPGCGYDQGQKRKNKGGTKPQRKKRQGKIFTYAGPRYSLPRLASSTSVQRSP